jgi:cysteine-rich repeat protein
MSTIGRVLVLLGVFGGGMSMTVRDVPATAPDIQVTVPDEGAHCGNGQVEPGETCDDGNTKDGDDCPSNCRIATCRPTSRQVTVSVEFLRSPSLVVGGVVVLLDYPDGTVSIPGSIGEPSVGKRISNLPKNFASASYNLDYALRETVLMNRPLPAGEIFRVGFDLCEGASPPQAKDFTCRVEGASSPAGQTVPLDGLTCSVDIR